MIKWWFFHDSTIQLPYVHDFFMFFFPMNFHDLPIGLAPPFVDQVLEPQSHEFLASLNGAETIDDVLYRRWIWRISHDR